MRSYKKPVMQEHLLLAHRATWAMSADGDAATAANMTRKLLFPLLYCVAPNASRQSRR